MKKPRMTTQNRQKSNAKKVCRLGFDYNRQTAQHVALLYNVDDYVDREMFMNGIYIDLIATEVFCA